MLKYGGIIDSCILSDYYNKTDLYTLFNETPFYNLTRLLLKKYHNIWYFRL